MCNHGQYCLMYIENKLYTQLYRRQSRVCFRMRHYYSGLKVNVDPGYGQPDINMYFNQG